MFSKMLILLAVHAVSELSGTLYYRNEQVFSLVFFLIYFQPLAWLQEAGSHEFPVAMSMNIQRSWRKCRKPEAEKDCTNPPEKRRL